MFQLLIRRIPAWVSIPFLVVLLFPAPAFCRTDACSAEYFFNGSPLIANWTATDLLVFVVLGLAVASAALAVRMVRHWH